MSNTAEPGNRIAAVLARQRAACLSQGAPTLAQRRADLRRLKQTILANREACAAAVDADFGHRSAHETLIMELLTLVQGIDYLRRHLRHWMRPVPRHVALHFQPARSYVMYQPLGVVGIISPWNYPLSLALMPLATALAAGNRVMLKPSEFTPATSSLLERLLGEVFEPEQVAVVSGDAAVGAAFAAQPFDHIVFTGSTRVGQAVMQAAAANLVPVTLELGGKSPAIVDRGFAAAAAAALAYGKLANAGQTCIAPDYALVHADEAGAFREAYDAAVRRLYPAGPMSDQYSAILDRRHFERIEALLQDARSRGARVVEVGHPLPAACARPHTLAPALVFDVDDGMRIMREEIFGPVLPVATWHELDEAIDYVNAHPRPLALYYFGPAGAGRERVLARTTSGNVTINDTLMHYAQDDLPFGGVGGSGMGAYHGVEGFRALSHAKGVFEQGRWNLSALLRPPFGRLTELILKLMFR
ncbi:MAG TPA: coniferyl aldehyde dehydrogenase [Steroidobacteraceae bacterium]|nr:coniferyl aldehyde dehydrogenase [Steroidobacteraceae bacterium]